MGLLGTPLATSKVTGFYQNIYQVESEGEAINPLRGKVDYLTASCAAKKF